MSHSDSLYLQSTRYIYIDYIYNNQSGDFFEKEKEIPPQTISNTRIGLYTYFETMTFHTQ